MNTLTALSLASSLFLASVSAQAQYTIDPNSVSNSTRQFWCQSQQTQCPLICLQTPAMSAETEANSCDPASLTYACICSNGLSPNVTEFSQTLPYFICTEWGTQCVSNCNGDSSCQAACRDDHPCGAQNPTRVNTSTISSTRSGSATSGAPAGASTNAQGTVFTGFGGAAASSTGAAGASQTGSSAAAAGLRTAALNAGHTFGALGVVGLVFGAFAVLL